LFKLLAGVLNGWFFSFNIFGRGFSFRLKNKNNELFLKLKIGYSHFVYFKLNKEILVKISKKRNKLFLFSLNFWLLYNVAYKLRNLRSLHIYKIQGILFNNEKITLKPGKKKQS
jgi:ribosomal protein L6P/L9E